MQRIPGAYKGKSGLQAHFTGYQGLPCHIVRCPPESYYHANEAGYKILKRLLNKSGNCQKARLVSGGLS